MCVGNNGTDELKKDVIMLLKKDTNTSQPNRKLNSLIPQSREKMTTGQRNGTTFNLGQKN